MNTHYGLPSRLFIPFVISFLVCLLTACGAAAPSPPPTAPPLAETLILYDWEEDMPQSVLDAFTEEFGVEVTYITYEAQEEAIENMMEGQAYDVIVLENQFIPDLSANGFLAEINYQNIPNIKNIAASFRDLAYDPGNKYSIPYNWGTTGIVARSDLLDKPVTDWTDLWDPDYEGKVALWRGTRRETIGFTLKSLGYSVNSEDPDELEAALEKLIALKPNILFVEDYDEAVEADSSAPLLANGEAIIGMGYAYDAVLGQEDNEAIAYILPEDGAMLWGDNFVIPANSPHKYTAELFLNFLLRPEISAQITNENNYPTPNEAARDFIAPEILNDPNIFPPNKALTKAEILLPLSPAGEKLHTEIWERFLAAEP